MEVAVPDVLTCRATLLTDAYWAIAGGPALPLRSRANFRLKQGRGLTARRSTTLARWRWDLARNG